MMIKPKLALVFCLILAISVSVKAEIIETENQLQVTANHLDNAIENNVNFVFGVDDFDENRFNVKFFESIIDTQTHNYSSYPKYDFYFAGIQRGLKIASLDVKILRTDPVTGVSYKVDSLQFAYNFPNKVKLDSEFDATFFTYILNPRQIGSFINRNRKSQKFNKLQGQSDWIHPDQEYYKFYSTRDGIARINQTELINKNSSWIGKNVLNFEIYNRGKKVKFYSTTNAIQHNGYIYLVVSHPRGDTSYFDFYNGKEPYFITYNPDKTSDTYTKIDNTLLGTQLQSVEVANHYEKDNVYGNGFDVTETEKVLCENWYIGEVRVQNDFNHAWEFFTDFTLFPTSDLQIEYNYASNIFYLPETVYNKTLLKINNQSYDTVSSQHSQIIDRTVETPLSQLMYGSNFLNLNSYKVVDDNQTGKYNGIIGLDYFNITGNILPIAENSYLSFIYDNQTNAHVNIKGFESSDIIVMDTVNNTIQFPQASSSNILSIDNIGRYSSIYYNKLVYSSNKYGYHIVSNLDGTSNSIYFQSEAEFISAIENMSNANNLAIVINTEGSISNQVKSVIQQKLGSSIINSANKRFMFAKINGKLYESVTDRLFNTDVEGSYYSATINLPQGLESRKIVCSAPYLQEISLEKAKLEFVEEGDYDAFYIYHPVFESKIDEYINYMSAKENKRILKIDVEQLYDTYGYGIESPHSIKNFLQEAYLKWKQFPEFLTLVGDATWDPKGQLQNSFVEQRIPVYGIPYTDNFYGTLDGDDLIPELVIGRIPCNTAEDLDNYLQKVKTFYELPLNPWMKNILQISGGDEGQKENFTTIMQGLNVLFATSDFNFDTTLVSKTASSTVSEKNADQIKAEINEGKLWVNFLGHGSPSVIDMSGWEAPNLNNQGKYCILNTMSCNTSAFAEPWQYNSIGEEYVTIKNKGTIATIGGTASTNVGTALSVSTSIFFTLLNKTKLERNIGRIYNSYKPRNANSRTALNQVVLLGDPLITIRLPKQPELLLFKKDIDISNAKGNSIIIEGDTAVKVKYIAYNMGIINTDSIDIQIIHTYKSTSDTLYQRIEPLGFHKNLEFELELNNSIGEHKVSINIDYDSTSDDFDFSNNLVDTTFNVFSMGIMPIEPLDNWNVSSKEAIFRFVNPTHTPKRYDFKILDSFGNYVFSSNSPKIYENYIEVTVDNLPPNKRYLLEYKTTELNTGITSDTKTIEFHTQMQIDSVVHYEAINRSKDISYNNLKLLGDSLIFVDKEYSVLLSSARGTSTGAERHSIINTYDKSDGNKEFRYINRLRRGFDLVIIPDIVEDTNVVNLQFDTWESLNPDFDMFEDSRRLDKYLHDSLPYGYYLLLATADVPMRAPDIIENEKSPDSLGSSSRIIQALKNLGAKNADSLGFNSSYVLFTRIGFPESTLDKHLIGDTIQLTTDFTRYQTNGHLSVKNIRNIKRLIGGSVELTGGKLKLKSSLTSVNGDTLYQTNKETFNLDDIDVGSNANLTYNLDIQRDSVGTLFSFKQFSLDFIPAPELAIVASQTNFENDSYERGDVANYHYKVQNLSTRSDAEQTVFNFTLDNNFKPETVFDTINVIKRDNSISSIKAYQTKDLALKNSLTLTLDPDKKQNELYTFNNINKTNLNVREDTTRPWLVAYADSIELNGGDVVTQRPVFSIELFDKSPLEVLQSDAIFVRVNRRVILPTTTDSLSFELINDGDLKARLTFIANFDLDIGDNSLQIIGKDATGNYADTLDLDVFVPNKNEITDVANFPNPFYDITTFRFKYIGTTNKAKIKISIFDAIGNKVKSIVSEVNFGENEIIWSGRDDFERSISSGAYYYRIDMLDKYAEPVFGRMIRVR